MTESRFKKMNDFTFVMITYNQRQYVVQHLESIRYQIEHHGQWRTAHFVLCDDCSKDDTVAVVKAWLEDNPGLFETVRIIAAEQNAGITKNNLVAMRCVESERFKVLAGDDMYYKNDVMSANDQGHFVASPVIFFAGDKVVPDSARWSYKLMLLHRDRDLKEYLRSRMRYRNQLETPGVFFTKELVTNEFCSVLDDYSWLEDAPLWSYHLSREDSTVSLHPQALVLYRVDSGASNNTGHARRAEYLADVAKLDREIFVDRTKYPAWRNPYTYRAKAERIMVKYFLNHTNKTILEFRRTVEKFEREGQEYLRMITERANNWMNAHFPQTTQ